MSDVYGGGWTNGEMPLASLRQHFKDRRAAAKKKNEEYSARVHQASLAQQDWMDRVAFAHQSTADLAQRLGPKSRIASAGYTADGSVAVTWHQPAPPKPRTPSASSGVTKPVQPVKPVQPSPMRPPASHA